MRTAARYAALLAFSVAVSGLSATTAEAVPKSHPITLYASPTGHGNSCSSSDPCSLTGAAAKVRTLNQHMTSDIDVDLHGGTYRLASTFQLGPQDSGSNGFHVVYQPVRNEQPVLTGATRVTGFAESDPALGIWRARVGAAGTATGGQQLFVDGQRATPARSAGVPAGLTTTATGFHTTDSSYASFTNQAQIEVVQDNDWKHMSCPVQNITADPGGGSDINIAPSCWSANHVNVPNLGFPFNGAGLPAFGGVSYLENAYQLLTKPGQFYLDQRTGYLYYIPAPGQNMHSADVELPTLQTLVSLNGTPGHLSPVNQNVPGASYTGAWGASSNRGYGDLGNDVAYTATNGASVSYTFSGTGLEVLGETNSDEGSFSAAVDGVADTRQHWTESGPSRLAQQVVYSVQGLSPGTHTVTLTSTSSDYLVVDGFETTPQVIAPVRDITFQGIGFAYSTWNLPVTTGYIDNQAAVLWNTSGPTTTPLVTPGAVAVSRGSGIDFSDDSFEHLGATGVDLADGTQNSAVTGSTITDTAAGGVSVGDVDDYFQNDPSLMDSGNTISGNAISHVGQDYTDAVGIWAGYTRDLTVTHNDIGHTSYSGMSIGWGWGWASPCSMQAAEGTSCVVGTNYAGDNRITDNYVHDVMNVLHDGGPIYTNGAQGENGAGVYSVLAGNYVTVGNDTNNMLYQDEGSSYWDTYDNVTSLSNGGNWIGMWTPTINNITVGPVNFTDDTSSLNNGTNISYTAPTAVAGNNWPTAAQAIMSNAGLTPTRATDGTVDNDSQLLAYTGTWSAHGTPGGDDTHTTTAQGASVTLPFTGSSIALVTDKGPGQGNAQILIDGVSKGTVSTQANRPEAGQTVFTADGLSAGAHNIQVVSAGGGQLSIDSFQIPAQPYLSVAESSAFFTPGTAFTVTGTISNPTGSRLTDGRAALSAPSGWTIGKPVRVPSVAADATATVSFTVKPPSTQQAGDPVTLDLAATFRAARAGRTTLVGTVQTSQPFASLAAAFDNTGISDDTATAAADIDGSQSSLSAQALAAQGVTPGAALAYDGITFTWPGAAAGQSDNVAAAGQTIDMTGSGNELGILDTATYGPAGGVGLITYTDGTTQSFTLTVPDWYGTASAGSNPVIVCAYRNRPGNTQDHTSVNIFEQSVPLTAGKAVAAVTLPDVSDSGGTAMHVFALGIGG